MSLYKLIYFNMRGRAELSRYILAYAKIPFLDHRVEWTDWPSIKTSFPMEQLPVLEVDGVELNQSLAIARFLAKEAAIREKGAEVGTGARITSELRALSLWENPAKTLIRSDFPKDPPRQRAASPGITTSVAQMRTSSRKRTLLLHRELAMAARLPPS